MRRPPDNPNPRASLGGIIHTYQAFDPKSFPSPTAPPPDLVSGAFEHMLAFGSTRQLTDEELARAIHLDPSQIKGLGPSLDALIAMLEERKRKILATYETESVQESAMSTYHDTAASMQPPARFAKHFPKAVANEQVRDLEDLWYRAGDERSPFARGLLQLIERLGEKYQVDELAAKYDFTGQTPLTVPEAILVKQELEKIDELLKQLREARKTAQIGIIDMEALAEFAEPGDLNQLSALQQQIQDYLREMAQQQGLEHTPEGYKLSPKAMRLFQGRLLEEIFSELDAARSGRHTGPIVGEGAVEIPRTKGYEFGDSVTHMDVPQSMINALLREASESPSPLRGGGRGVRGEGGYNVEERDGYPHPNPLPKGEGVVATGSLSHPSRSRSRRTGPTSRWPARRRRLGLRIQSPRRVPPPTSAHRRCSWRPPAACHVSRQSLTGIQAPTARATAPAACAGPADLCR
jgi:hypothetical protein